MNMQQHLFYLKWEIVKYSKLMSLISSKCKIATAILYARLFFCKLFERGGPLLFLLCIVLNIKCVAKRNTHGIIFTHTVTMFVN